MELGLFQKQTTKLVMTTELRQAITILQYSTLELADYLKEEALENPLMELKENSSWENALSGDSSSIAYRKPAYNQDDEKRSPLDQIRSKDDHLHARLLEQVRDLSLSKRERSILIFLVENINDAGYLTVSLDEAARLLHVHENDVVRAFERFRMFDPPGVGARSLQECLLWQLESLGHDSLLAEDIVAHDLDLFANKKWNELAKKYDVTLKDIQEAADLIQSLDPKPGASFGDDTTRYLIPDITVEHVEGKYIVTINDYLLPNIQLNRQYQYMLSQTDKSEAQTYIHEKYNKMMWLIKSIEQRRFTLLRLTEAIVEKQKEFLEKGMLYLKPMTLKEIADEIGVHESTVSRAIRNKVVQTPRGIYELKDFFTSKVQSASGEGASSKAVKLVIQSLIDKEDKRKPLSDQKIVELLKDEGIEVSRRTVAKYRDEMKIPSSSKRKRFQ